MKSLFKKLAGRHQSHPRTPPQSKRRSSSESSPPPEQPVSLSANQVRALMVSSVSVLYREYTLHCILQGIPYPLLVTL